MPMLCVDCLDCGYSFCLSSDVEPKDLVGTEFENLTQDEIDKNYDKFSQMDEWSKFEIDEKCPVCDSRNLIYL